MAIARLKYLTAYMIGPIDADPELGASWREAMTVFLEGLGVYTINPLNKPVDGASEIEQRDIRPLLIKEKRYDELKKIMKKIRGCDLRFVDKSDFMVVNLDLSIPMCGTWEEIYLANRERKPIIVMCPQGKDSIPYWLFGTLPHELFFNNWDEVKTYLNHVNSDEEADTVGDRWLFFTR